MIASIDGVNRLIYLDASTVGVDFNTIDLYKEMRTMRELDDDLKQYEIFLKSYGNLPKVTAKGTATERGVVTQSGTKIVPFDTAQTLSVITTIISDDGTVDGADCFDTSGLVNKVNIHYIPPQVEVITVITGGSALTTDEHNKLMGVPTAEETANAVLDTDGDCP